MSRVLTSLLATGMLVVFAAACSDGDGGSRGGTGVGTVPGGGDGTVPGVGDVTVPDEEPPVLQETCVGAACYCLRMGVVGTFDSAADKNDVSAFVNWLNTKSNAQVSMVSTKPVLDDSFLANYDILLFLNQSDGVNGPFWTYTEQEAANLRQWIANGGGIVTVTGFNGAVTPQEVGAMNSILLPATGLSYNSDKYLAEEETNLDPTSYCYANAAVISGFDPNHDISREVSRIAAFWGSSINAPEGAQIVATQADADSVTDNAIVGMEIGYGRALAIADEWPLLSNVWLPTGNTTVNEYDTCYDPATGTMKTPDNYFQLPQFWYNSIWWTAPENDCFTIDEPVIVPII